MCRQKACIALVHSVLEYGAVVWDPHLQQDTLERVPRWRVRFVTGGYKSRTPGCVTTMLSNQKLVTLQERRRQLRLTFPADEFLVRQKPKWAIRAKKFTGCEANNIVENQARNNTKCFEVGICAKDIKQFRNSFFVRTLIEWNQLDDKTACAGTVEEFPAKVAAATGEAILLLSPS